MAIEQGIPGAALPNKLAPEELRIRPDPEGGVAVDPRRAGWRYLGFHARALRADDALPVGDASQEAVLVVIAGGGLDVEVSGGATLGLPGRTSPFDALPWAAYFPARCMGTARARPHEAGGAVRVAVAYAPVRARAGVATAPLAIGPADVAVEIRGRGNASRQVNHIVAPGFPADRLLAVEVLTPAGNWSSWPPHKHDRDDMPTEAVLEEIYYYQLRRTDGWGIQRLYRKDGSRDDLWAVRDGELVIVPDGYHPFVASHGYDAYYLNVLAGDRRTMACSFDPDLDWTRAAWDRMEPDGRLPLVRPGDWPRPIDLAVGSAGAVWGSVATPT